MRPIKFSYMWTDGKSWMDLRYTLDEVAAGDPIHDMSDQPLLKNFRCKAKRQFTGLCDQNGVEIYESDVVVLKAPWGGFQDIVVFENGCFGIRDGNLMMIFTLDINPETLEVIGNIHEHPHLLNQSACKHGETSIVCPLCDLEAVKKEES